MAIPMVPVIAVGSIVGGAIALPWYYSLSAEDRKAIDQKVTEVALCLIKTIPTMLSMTEFQVVLGIAKAEIA